MKKAIIKLHKRAIGVVYFSKYTEAYFESIKTKVYRFFDEEGKMIFNMLLDPKDIEEGFEVEIQK